MKSKQRTGAQGRRPRCALGVSLGGTQLIRPPLCDASQGKAAVGIPGRGSVRPMTIRKGRRVGQVTVYEFHCTCVRCKHSWISRSAEPPRTCAGCKASGWNQAPRPYRRRKAR